MSKWEKVAGGTWGAYRPEPENHGWVWGVIAVFTTLGLLSQCG